jgi:hypothetical protein
MNLKPFNDRSWVIQLSFLKTLWQNDGSPNRIIFGGGCTL